MDRFKNMHLFKAAQSGKVARSVITLRDLILMYLFLSVQQQETHDRQQEIQTKIARRSKMDLKSDA